MSEMRIFDAETKFEKDIRAGKTFLVDTSIDYAKMLGTTAIHEKDTLFSWKFDIKPNFPAHLLIKKYRCDCGLLMGQDKSGKHCDHCDSVVTQVEQSPSLIAYMKICDGIRLLSPVGLLWMERLIGGKFKEYLAGKLHIHGKNPDSINIIYDTFEETLHKYAKKNMEEMVKYMIDHKNQFFTNLIPVVSSKIRFMEQSQNMGVGIVDSSDMNTPYIRLSSLINALGLSLEEQTPRRTIKLIYDIQESINRLGDALIITAGGDKGKMLRDGVYSMRVPYTAMAVLAPLVEYPEMDSCTIPIEVFRVTFKKEIFEILCNWGYDIISVTRLLRVEYKLSDQDKTILKMVFKHMSDNRDDMAMYINRQPTMGFESISLLKIREIRDEKVLRIHPNVFTGLNADCDGDALIMVGMSATVRAHFYSKLKPSAFIIDWDLHFNRKYGLKNDYQALFYKAMRY